jgi:periplasmic protein TonB
MAQLIKELPEVSAPNSEPAVSGAGSQLKNASGHLRTDAVSLEISIKVHGSRVTEVVREVTPQSEPFEEQTTTMIVFPEGAVLRMSTAVNVGQMLVLTNLKSGKDAICRVVKIRTFSNAQGYVEVEFSHAQPGYWGVNIPSNSSTGANKIAPTPPSAVKREESKTAAVSEPSRTPARVASPAVSKPVAASAPPIADHKPFSPAPPPPARSNMPESSFIAIGSQEETQAAASSTSRTASLPAPPPRIEPKREVRTPEPPKRNVASDFPAAPPSVPLPSLSMAELLGDEIAVPAAPSDTSNSRDSSVGETDSSAPVETSAKSFGSTFGSLSGGATLGSSLSQHSELFGAGVDSSAGELTGSEAAPRQNNRFLIAACIFIVFAAMAGGVFYFRQQLGLQKSAVPASAMANQINSNDANRTSVAQPSVAQGNQPASNLSSTTPMVTIPGTTVTVSADPVPTAKSSAPAPSEPAVTPKQPSRSVTSGMMATTLNSHPVSLSRASAAQADAAPSIDAGETVGDPAAPLPGLSSSANIPPPPPAAAAPEGPVKVGGEVKEPRLITYKQPDYPLVAKQAHIQGDVLISTEIDKAGNVIHVEAISGPMMLRQAALEALRRWKYAPSTLNGQPVPVEMRVTVQFRM